MSNIVFREKINKEEILTSFIEEKKVGARVVYLDTFYKIIAMHGAGKSFSITLEEEYSKKKKVISGNAVRSIRVVVDKTYHKKESYLDKVIAFVKRVNK